jgi:hypothetical protein
MKPVALGFRMHSGWGVLVAVSHDDDSVQVVARKRIVVMNSEMPGGNQPYHYAAELLSQGKGLAECEKYIANCRTVCESMAVSTVLDTVQELKKGQYRLAGAAVLTAAGRTLPSLADILASHPLIHTAEGEFYRNAVRKSCEHLKISVEAIGEREVEKHAKSTYGSEANRVQGSIAALGKSIGPPWTSDHKAATLGALLVLHRKMKTA